MTTNGQTDKQTDRISYLRLDPALKRNISSKGVKKTHKTLSFPDIDNHSILSCPIFTNFKFSNSVPRRRSRRKTHGTSGTASGFPAKALYAAKKHSWLKLQDTPLIGQGTSPAGFLLAKEEVQKMRLVKTLAGIHCLAQTQTIYETTILTSSSS